MDASRFDRLTRRWVISVLTSGPLVALLGRATSVAAGRSKRKRCRQKGRVFCAGRCCPKRFRCEAKTCFASCGDPFNCANAGDNCAGNDECVCLTTLGGAAGCFADIVVNSCDDADACGADNPCPSGQICAICNCPAEPNFRCFLPCPTA